MTGTEETWEAHYSAADRVWARRPNATLVREVRGLPPRRALDLGCGEGGDAVWLARNGWRVTAVDVSPTALRRAADHAAEERVAERMRFLHHDLSHWSPDDVYDLVSVQFFHSWEGPPRAPVLRAAARSVAPSGTLLIVSHVAPPSWSTDGRHAHVRFETPEETLASLRLDPDDWAVKETRSVEREVTAPDGSPAVIADGVVRLVHR